MHKDTQSYLTAGVDKTEVVLCEHLSVFYLNPP